MANDIQARQSLPGHGYQGVISLSGAIVFADAFLAWHMAHCLACCRISTGKVTARAFAAPCVRATAGSAYQCFQCSLFIGKHAWRDLQIIPECQVILF